MHESANGGDWVYNCPEWVPTVPLLARPPPPESPTNANYQSWDSPTYAYPEVQSHSYSHNPPFDANHTSLPNDLSHIYHEDGLSPSSSYVQTPVSPYGHAPEVRFHGGDVTMGDVYHRSTARTDLDLWNELRAACDAYGAVDPACFPPAWNASYNRSACDFSNSHGDTFCGAPYDMTYPQCTPSNRTIPPPSEPFAMQPTPPLLSHTISSPNTAQWGGPFASPSSSAPPTPPTPVQLHHPRPQRPIVIRDIPTTAPARVPSPSTTSLSPTYPLLRSAPVIDHRKETGELLSSQSLLCQPVSDAVLYQAYTAYSRGKEGKNELLAGAMGVGSTFNAPSTQSPYHFFY
jgi:hypothetical protein